MEKNQHKSSDVTTVFLQFSNLINEEINQNTESQSLPITLHRSYLALIEGLEINYNYI